MAERYGRWRSFPVAILILVVCCCVPHSALAEGGRRVVISVDSSGSMWAVGASGHQRLKTYLAAIIYGGFDPGTLASVDDRVSLGSTEQWLRSGLCADTSCNATYFTFSDASRSATSVDSAQTLLELFPTTFRGQTNLGTAAKQAVTELDSAPSGVDELYWVYVSDNVLESVDARDQRIMLSEVSRENWIQPVFAMSVYNESVVDGKTYPGTAYIEVRRVHSMERVARLVDELAALLDELESQLQQPDSDYAQVLEQLSAIEKQLADMNAVLAALSSPDNPRAEDLQTRIDALEQEVARLAELATPPGTCTLLFPENDSTLTVSQVDLIWNVAARAAEYTLDIRKPDGSQIIETISETRYTLDVASAPGPYAWTVTAVGSASVGGQALTTPCAGGIHTFEIAAPAPTQPPSFYLVSPAAGEASTAGVIAFEWEQVQGLQDYVLEVRMPDGSVREAVGQGGAVTIELGAGDYQWSVRAALAGGGVIGAANGPRALRVVPLPAPTPVPFVFLSPRPSACQVASRPVRFEWGSAGPEMTYDLAVKALATGDIIAATSTAETWAELYLEPGIYSWEVQAHSSDGAVLAMRGSGVRFAVRTECSEGGLGWLLILPLIVIGGLIALRIARTKSKDYWLEEVSEDDMALGNGEHFVITTAAPLNGVRLGMDDVTQDDHPVFDVGAPNALIRRGWFGGFTLQEGATKRSIRLGRSVDVTDINGIKRWVRLQTTEPPSSEEDSVGPLEIPSDADL